MDELYIAGVEGFSILIVNKLKLIEGNKKDPLSVDAVKVDFDLKKIYEPEKFQRHLKFGNWQEPTEDQQIMFLQLLNSKFSDSDILRKIILPLTKNSLE